MELPQQSSSSSQYIINEPKYKGVRKRKWGKWVSEIRLPNSRERIWLGSYESPEKAARAFDAALYCLRGPAARFNFPDDPPSPSVIGGGRLLRPQEIQAVAAQYANNYEANREGRRGEEATAAMMTTSSTTTRATTTTLSPRDGNGEGNYSNTTSDEDGVVRVASGTTIDWSFLDSREQGAGAAAASDHHFELFSGMDNMSMNMDMNMNMGGGDYYHDPQHMMIFDSNDVINDHHYHHDEMLGDHEPASYSLSSFLWNF